MRTPLLGAVSLVAIIALAAFLFSRLDDSSSSVETVHNSARSGAASTPSVVGPDRPLRSDPPVRATTNLSAREYLALGNPPTQKNVIRMITAIIECNAPWSVRRQIAALLLEDALDDDPADSQLDELDANAALLVLSQALSLLNEPNLSENDREQARILAEYLLAGMWQISADRQDNIARILLALNELPPNAIQHLRPLLSFDVAPNALVQMIRGWTERLGGDGVSLMLALVDHPDPRLSGTAIGFLMLFDPDQYLPMALDQIKNLAPGTHAPFYSAIGRGLPTDRAVSVLTALGDGLTETSINDAMRLWNVLGAVMRDSTDEVVLDLLRKNPGPDARNLMLLGLGFERPQMLEGILSDPEFVSSRGRILISLSHGEPTPRLAEITREALREHPEQTRNILTAARNMCQKGKGAPWLAPLKADLATLALDPDGDMLVRGSAVSALRKAMTEVEYESWVARTDLPGYVRKMLTKQ